MKALILLGNRMNDDGTLSSIAIERLTTCIHATELFHPDLIILSGGSVNKKANISEAEAMMNYLSEHHFDFPHILLEKQSKTTKENAKYTLELCHQHQVDSIILITSKEHFARSWLNPIKLFEKELEKYHSISLSIYSE